MKRIPYGKYTKEFREETVRLVLEGGLSEGTVEVEMGKFMNWVGDFTDATAAMTFARSGGIPLVGMVEGGKFTRADGTYLGGGLGGNLRLFPGLRDRETAANRKRKAPGRPASSLCPAVAGHGAAGNGTR